MKFEVLKSNIEKYPEFKRIKLTKPPSGEIFISYTGHLIGKEADEKLRKLGRQHGFHMLSNELQIWESEEYYQMYKDL